MASKIDHSAVRTLIALDNPVICKGLAEALRHAGFGVVETADSLDGLKGRMDEAEFDVVVSGSELAGKYVGGWVRELRAGRLVHHAFPLVLIYLSQGGPEHVRKVIDCGPDDILLPPVVPGQLLTRIEILAARRKAFVVTHDYTGPDRRKETRAGTDQAPQIEVPNPLKARVAKQPAEALAAEIAGAAQRLNMLKLQAYAVQLRWTEATLGALLDNPNCDAIAVQPHLARLEWLAADLAGRTKSAVDGQTPQAVEQLAATVRGLLRAAPKVDRSRWKTVPPLCAGAADAIRTFLGK